MRTRRVVQRALGGGTGWAIAAITALTLGLSACAKTPETKVTLIEDDGGAPTGPAASGPTAESTTTAAKRVSANTGATDTAVIETTGPPPTSTPTGERLADGSVVSAGGYVARTPTTKNGILKGPGWTKEQQPYVDLLYEYFDELQLAQMSENPTGEPTEAMLALEEPRRDLNAQATDPVHRYLKLRLKQNGKLTWPSPSRSQFVVTGVQDGKYSQLYRACEINDSVAVDVTTGKVVDASTWSVRWNFAVSLRGEEPRVFGALPMESAEGTDLCEW
jgi:hypothetical protein